MHQKSKDYMRYIEAPSTYDEGKSDDIKIFLAGGISGTPDWQAEMVELLGEQDNNLVLLNPRRKNFPIHDPSAAEAQIKWEHDQLRLADAILFWFPKETLCPIVLYELGAWSMTDKHLFVGVHPDYRRRQDVEIQTRLARQAIRIVYTLQELAQKVYAYRLTARLTDL
jgi:hypothetical protein